MIKISEKLANLDLVPLDKIVGIQGNLKDLTKVNYQKLKNSLLKHGFFVPFFVWNDNGIVRCLDGHQRLLLMRNEKWFIDVPVVYVEASNMQEAKEKLLVISSQYGLITQEGYDTFTFDLDEAYLQEMVNFDALKVWEESTGEPINPENEWTGMPEFEQENVFGAIKTLKVHFANEKDIAKFAHLMEQPVTMDTQAIWYPRQEKLNLKGYVAHDES